VYPGVCSCATGWGGEKCLQGMHKFVLLVTVEYEYLVYKAS